ncbi:MAG: Na+/H+ ion antiporter subunit [Rhodobacteraceae bacterium HLUCCA12]|nr:MAG: Na+/H+ ion antiporter subunit [Rhodobacteraceae bacterium HLUCCA12]
MPELVKLYIRQVLIGFALAGVFVAALLWADVARLRSLILATDGGWIALFLLFFFNGLVFAGVQFAIRVMQMAEPEKPDDDAGHRDAVPTLEPAVVRVSKAVAGPQRP